MSEDYYLIKVDGETVAKQVRLEYVSIFMTAIFRTFYEVYDLAITVERMPRVEMEDEHE